jgi:hypothetical protein
MFEPKRYKIKCPYTEIIEEEKSRTVEVEANNEVEAIEKAWIKVYEMESLDDDCCEEHDAEILEEESIMQPNDKKTLKLFDDPPKGDTDDCGERRTGTPVPHRDEETG